VLLAKQEAERGAVAVKDLRSGEQVEVPRQLVAGWLQERRETEGEPR
jgi:histidyl-tRNA synthetase